jgi:uncharacterized protein YcbX
MVVDNQGKFLTQRQHPQLATVKVEIVAKKIKLSHQDNSIEPLEFTPKEDNPQIPVQVWHDHTIAIDQGDNVAQWFQQVLSINDCRLVKQSSQHIRPISPTYSTQNNQPVSFADGFPYLLTNTASLKELNQRLEKKYPQQNQQIPMIRFRPNIVIETQTPFIEDRWHSLTIGKITFDLVKPCSRCQITTTDQKTGAKNPFQEPLTTLSSFRHIPQQGIMFGQNMIPQNHGIIDITEAVNPQ